MKYRRIEVSTATGRRDVVVRTLPTRPVEHSMATARLPELTTPQRRQRFRMHRAADGQPRTLEIVQC